MNTFFLLLRRELELARLGDFDGLVRLASGADRRVFNLLYNVVALENFAEDNVPAIEPGRDDRGDEELKVGLLACCTSSGALLLT